MTDEDIVNIAENIGLINKAGQYPLQEAKIVRYVRTANDVAQTELDLETISLMLRHGIYPVVYKNTIWIGNSSAPWFQCEPIVDHPNKVTAIQVAIRKAALAKVASV